MIGIVFGELSIWLLIIAMVLLFNNAIVQIIAAIIGIWFLAWVIGLIRAGWATHEEGLLNKTPGATYEAIVLVYSRMTLPLTIISTFALIAIFVAEH